MKRWENIQIGEIPTTLNHALTFGSLLKLYDIALIELFEELIIDKFICNFTNPVNDINEITNFTYIFLTYLLGFISPLAVKLVVRQCVDYIHP